MRIFYLLGLNHIVNFELKNLFALPRPFHLDPAVGIIQVGGYGFPSGAAQSAILLSGLLLIYWKSRWKWVVAGAYAVLLSFSRLYLGVHFPIDILGGWTVGFLLLGIYLFVFPKVERFFENKSPLNALLINYFLLIALMFWLPTKTVISISACAIGLGMGVFINRVANICNPIAKTKWAFWTRILIGIGGVFLIYGLASKMFNLQSLMNVFLVFIVIGLWISFVVNIICNKLTISWTKES